VPPEAAESERFRANDSKLWFARNRRNDVPTGMTFCGAFSFIARFACKYAFVVSMNDLNYFCVNGSPGKVSVCSICTACSSEGFSPNALRMVGAICRVST